MKARIFAIYLLSFILGIFIAPYISIEPNILLYTLFGVLLLLPFYYKTKIFKHILVSVAVIFFAIWHYGSVLPKDNPSWIGYYNDKELEMEGVIDSEPITKKATRFFFKPKLIDDKEVDINGNVQVIIRKEDNVEFGESLKIKGTLKEPENFDDFDYKSYLARFDVYSTMSFPEHESISSIELSTKENLWMGLKNNLFTIKHAFIYRIEQIFPEPSGSLMLGLLLGIKKTMPDWLLDAFNSTGTTHIIALSGFNITIIVMLLKNMTKGLSRRMNFWIPISIIFLFVIMSGAEAPVVRAAIMGSMLLLANKVGRQDNATVAVLFAAAVMIFFNPLILAFDVAFQLSFASMIGIIYVTPLFVRLLRRLPQIISENLGMTLAAQFMAAPIILYNFSELSLIAPLANVLVLPAVPLAMLFGFLAAVIHFALPPLGEMIGWIGHILTSYIIGVSDFLSKLPFSSVNFDVSSPIWLFIYYFIVIDLVLIIRRYLKQKDRQRIYPPTPKVSERAGE